MEGIHYKITEIWHIVDAVAVAVGENNAGETKIKHTNFCLKNLFRLIV